MTDKQIIINGVDVSECSYYQHNMCTATKDDYGDCSLCCQDYDMNDCYYKQLKRKEQECEELKNKIEFMEEYIKTVEKARNEVEQQLDQLKAENDLYKNAHKTEQDRRRSYENTLAEIKEIAEECYYKCNSMNNCNISCKYYNNCNGEFSYLLACLNKQISECEVK